MKKRFIPLAIAASLAFCAAPVTAAADSPFDFDSEYFAENYHIADWSGLKSLEGYDVYLNNNSWWGSYAAEDKGSFLTFTIQPESETALDGVKSLLESKDLTYYNGTGESVTFGVTDISSKADKNVREIAAQLGQFGTVEDFHYYGRLLLLHSMGGTDSYLTRYDLSALPDIEKTLSNYVAEHSLNCSVVVFDEEVEKENTNPDGTVWTSVVNCDPTGSSDMFFQRPSVCLIPDEGMTDREFSEAAQMVADDLGLKYNAAVDQSFSQECPELDIDMLSMVDGDVNASGSLDLGDAVGIMQSIANPDKFALTPEQKFLADVNDTGDGVTAKDAQTIQRRLLKLE